MYIPLNQSIIIQDLTCKLCLVIWKMFVKMFLVHFSQKVSDFPTNHWSMICFIGNVKPRVHPNICQEIKVLSCMLLEKHFTTKFFHFRQKSYFYPKMMELWNVYMLLNQYISINDLTCKVWLRDILLSII